MEKIENYETPVAVSLVFARPVQRLSSGKASFAVVGERIRLTVTTKLHPLTQITVLDAEHDRAV
jgi:hypothetical protein